MATFKRAGTEDFLISYADPAVIAPEASGLVLTGNVTGGGLMPGSNFDLVRLAAGPLVGGGDDDNFSLVDTTGPVTVTFGAGNDSLSIVSSPSRFEYPALPRVAFVPVVTITDISAGDRLLISDVLEFHLTNWNGFTNPFSSGHMRLVQSGADAKLQIDSNGGANSFTDFVIFQNSLVANLTTANLGGLPANGGTPPAVVLTGTPGGGDSLVGGAGADTITLVGQFSAAYGGAGNDTMQGGLGFGTLAGGAGNDVMTGGGTTDYLFGDAGNDQLTSGTGYAYLNGGSGTDVLSAAAASETELIGGLGFDTVTGGAGQDAITIEDPDNVDGAGGDDSVAFDLSASASGVTINMTAMGAGVNGSFGAGTISNVEFVSQVVGSSQNDVLNFIGTSNGQQINGGGGNDVITGGSAADFALEGGTGNDTINGNAGNDVLVGGDGDDTLNGGNDNDQLNGGKGTDELFGGAGNDRLDGLEPDAASVVERLHGGTGDDQYFVDGTSDVVYENAGEGRDDVTSFSGYYLWDNIERLFLSNRIDGANDFFGVGNGLDNDITGNDGANLLIGGAGNDTIRGGIGGDALFGESGNDSLFGDVGIDYLVGGIGNDTLDGGASADAIYGEDGNDTLIGGSTFSTDIMVGGNGDDILNGASTLGDYDLMDGAAGNDTYYVDTPADLTFEAAGGGTDTVYADIVGGGYYLYAFTENLVLQGITPFGVGNELNNELTGAAIGNWLLGGLGNDTLNGKAGNDVLFGEGGTDTFVFERGTGGDVIGDFLAGVDKIRLVGLGFSSFAQVQAAFIENAGTTAINLGSGDLVVINGVTNAQLTATDFLFG